MAKELLKKIYISLIEASKLSPYSQEYLSLRARQGKLRAVKVGRNWMTTKEWLNDYVSQVKRFKQEKIVRSPKIETAVLPATENDETLCRSSAP